MAGTTRKVGLYVRVSTSDGRTVANQERELQAVAVRHGWQVMATFADEGVFGARSRDQRPAMPRAVDGISDVADYHFIRMPLIVSFRRSHIPG